MIGFVYNFWLYLGIFGSLGWLILRFFVEFFSIFFIEGVRRVVGVGGVGLGSC